MTGKTHPFTTLKVTGPDTEKFLQGQLTCDVTKLSDEASLAACCNQKGRMIANFWVWKTTEAINLAMPAAMVSLFLAHIKTYAVFSKVEFHETDSESYPNNLITDPAELLQQQIVFLQPETSGLFTPQMISWEKHGGVDFEKGCYLGQEIIARTQHLGKLKRHLKTFTLDGEIKVGENLLNEKGEAIGVVVSFIAPNGLAVVRD